MSILVVEDTPVSALLLENILDLAGYRTTVVSDGLDALQALERDASIELVIADIMMPAMDGLELLRQMRARPEWRSLPMIFCSSLTDVDIIRKAIELGCKHYIMKPIGEPKRVLDKVREVLESEPAVLEDDEAARSRLHMDTPTYRRMLTSMLDHVSRELSLLEGVDPDGFELDRERSLELLDTATALGAQRLTRLLKLGEAAPSVGPDPEIPMPPPPLLPSLLRELSALRAFAEARLADDDERDDAGDGAAAQSE